MLRRDSKSSDNSYMTLLERIGNPWEKARAAKSVLVQVIDSAPYHIVSTTLDVLDGVLQSDIASGASFRAEVDAPSCRDYITMTLLTATYCLSMMLQKSKDAMSKEMESSQSETQSQDFSESSDCLAFDTASNDGSISSAPTPELNESKDVAEKESAVSNASGFLAFARSIKESAKYLVDQTSQKLAGSIESLGKIINHPRGSIFISPVHVLNTAAGSLTRDEQSVKSQIKQIIWNTFQAIGNVANYVVESATHGKVKEKMDQEELREVVRADTSMIEAERKETVRCWKRSPE